MVLSVLLALALQSAAIPETKGVVRGAVTSDETGKPLKRAQVLLRKMPQGVDAFLATTDATGHFEIKLEPGRYRAVASKTGYVARGYHARLTSQNPEAIVLRAGTILEDANFSLAAGAVIAGRIVDQDGAPLPGVNVHAMKKRYNLQGKPYLQLINSAASDDHGEYRVYDLPPGHYYVKAESGEGKAPFGSVIYPNAHDMMDARTVAVALGAESKNVNLTLLDVKAYTVKGQLSDHQNAPVKEAWVTLWPVDWTSTTIGQAQARPDGSFRLPNVPTGRYRLQVISSGGAFVNKVIDVGQSDLTVALTLGGGATVKGVVTAEGGNLPASVRVLLEEDGPLRGAGQSRADGSFEIRGVQPCICVVGASAAVQGGAFYVSSVHVGEKDVTDSGFAVPEIGEVTVSVAIGLDGGRVTGRAVDPDDQPLDRVAIFRFNADPKKRRLQRFMEGELTDSKGMYRLVGMAPGDYLILLMADEEPVPIFDPEVFAKLEKYMVPVTVERGSVISKDLKLSKEAAAVFKTLQ